MIYLAAHLAGLGVLLLLLFATGRAVVWAVRGALPEAARDWPETMGLGMGAWMAYLFALAATGTLHPLTIFPPVLALLVGALVQALRSGTLRGLLRGETWKEWLPSRWPARGLLALIGAGAVVLFLRAAYPGVSWDAAVYHLTLPKLMLRAGGFVQVPLDFLSVWPLNAELLYLLAMRLQDHALAALLHLACGLLLAGTLVRTARQAGWSETSAWVTALLLLGNQVVLQEIGAAYVDLLFALLLFLAFRAVLRARVAVDPGRELLLAGVFCGLMSGVKLTGVLGCAAIGTVYLAGTISDRQSLRRTTGGALRLAVPTLLLVLPWHLRMLRLTGNPVYPFLYGVFGGREWSPALAADLVRFHDSTGMGRGALDYLLLPLRVAMSAFPGHQAFDGAISPAWVILLPLAVVFGRGDRLGRAALWAAAGFFPGWALATQQMRYFIPMLPLLALAAAAGLERITAGRRAASAWVGTAVAAAVLVASLALPAAEAVRLGATMLRYDTALPAKLVPPVFRFLNEATPPNARILFVNTNKGFYCERDFVADAIFEASQVADWLRAAPDVEATAARLRELGITHVLLERVDWGIAWPKPFLDLLGDPARAKPVYVSPEERFVLFELQPVGGSTSG